MTKTAKAVVGGSWGDEGKGLMTDFFADPSTIVVRYNGGAQAAHTVERPDGTRHVFHHFGSGTLRGARTFLSRFFICNPLLYFKERAELITKGYNPSIIVDPNAPVTTPFDMMINQMSEESRGDARHGSCGVGINETLKRHEANIRPLYAVDFLKDERHLRRALAEIRSEWVPERLATLGITPTTAWLDRLDNPAVIDAYLSHAMRFSHSVNFKVADEALAPSAHVVFEGAQGLLLDEDHHFFPHVTHSHTGLTNVDILATEAGIEHLDVTYVTRAYATRHGAGPFPHENASIKYDDPTNVPNMWQGALRFGELDLTLLAESIRDDLKKTSIPVTHHLAITCLDQVGSRADYWLDGAFHHSETSDMIFNAQRVTGAEKVFTSFGPCREHVQQMQNTSLHTAA